MGYWRHRERGAALVMALCIMLALMIVGVSAARSALNAEKAARAERDRHIAFQAAEAALGDAERDIEGGVNPERAKLFAAGSALGFMPGCGTAVNAGLCARTEVPAWQSAQLAEAGVEYGRFTGAAMATGQGTQAAKLPRYIIEPMPFVRAGDDASGRAGNFYRITALGFGARESTRVVLQSFYLKAAGEEES
ncbi:MAG: PilX N-terminal domain-containing pilus assembly protein [Pseudomonadota bacterium]